MPPTLAHDFVLPLLALGGRLRPEELPLLAVGHGVRHVVDLRLEDRDDEALLARHGMELLHLPTPDRAAVSQRDLDLGVTWSASRLAGGQAVLVHCEHGIGRSALLAMCVLVALGHDPLSALASCKACRPCVSPSPEQLEAFVAWVRRRPAIVPGRVPRFDELAAIAYRSLATPPAP